MIAFEACESLATGNAAAAERLKSLARFAA
jgi:hypothetical protein